MRTCGFIPFVKTSQTQRTYERGYAATKSNQKLKTGSTEAPNTQRFLIEDFLSASSAPL